MAIDKLPINDRLIDNVPGAPPPEDTPNEDPIDPQQPDLTCTPDSTKTKAYTQVVRVENTEGKAYGKATELYKKHRNAQKNGIQCNHFPLHMTFSKLSCLASKRKAE